MAIKKGTTSIGKVYVGNKEIDRIYKGSTLVYQNILLPREYQQVEYIESTGTQYIDTGIKVSSLGLEVKAKICCLSNQPAPYPRVFGARQTSPDRAFMLGQTRAWYGLIETNRTDSINLKDDTIHEITFNKNELFLDNVSYIINVVATSLTNIAFNICLFAEMENGNVINRSALKLYYFKLYNNGTIIRNYIPCYRKIDGVAGLYDTVNGVFYTNAGTGEFICGHPILSDDYDLLEYIESSGTQYIDSGFAPTNKTNANLTFSLLSHSGSTVTLLGMFNGWQTKFAFLVSSQQKLVWHYGETDSSHLSLISLNAKYTVNNIGINLYLNGTLEYTSDERTFVTNKSIYLFARNNDGSVNMLCNMKLYSCRIYDNNEIVRDYVPVVRLADNTIGLYDIKNDVFYTNAGSGTFVAGPYVFLSHKFQEVEYIESSGTQYIDTCLKVFSTIQIKTLAEPYNSTCEGLFGARLGINQENIRLLYTSGGYVSVGLWNMQTGTSDNILTTNYLGKHLFEINSGNFLIDNVLIKANQQTTKNTSTLNLYLFSYNNNGVVSSFGNWKMYNFKVYESNDLLLDLIPCYRKSDNVIGMFDKVTGVFYTNAGTDTFTKGDNV